MAEARLFPTVYTLIIRGDDPTNTPKTILCTLQEYFGSCFKDAIYVNQQTSHKDGFLLIDFQLSCESDTRSIARRTKLEYDQVVIKTKRHVYNPPSLPAYFNGVATHEMDFAAAKFNPQRIKGDPFGSIWNLEKGQWEHETFIYPQIEHDEL